MQPTDIFTFKYEPQSISEMIIHKDIQPVLEKFIIEQPNIMLIGPAGVGKGTFTNIFLKETGLDSIKINCSDETGVDGMRNKVRSFATALGISRLKVCILNECDFLSINGQALLRSLMEEVQDITRFIFMCNYGHKMLPEIKSRCQVVELNSPPAKRIYEHCTDILTKENITIKNPKAIVEVIKKLYPDIRRIINTLQMSVSDKALDIIKYESNSNLYEQFIAKMKEGDLEGIRKLIRNNIINYTELYSVLFENVNEFKAPGDGILLIAEYLYRDSMVAIKEISFIGMVVDGIKKGIW